MTDGILLPETQVDPYLEQYDTIIIDEAHERSLNIDFLLGYLKQLLPRRPDLKIIITSATIDPQRFSKHFNNAPILMVSGRMFPVEVRYRPPVETEEEEEALQLPQSIAAAASSHDLRFSACRLRRFPAPAPTSAKAAAAVSRPASASASSAKKISTPARNSLSRKFSAPTWPASSSR